MWDGSKGLLKSGAFLFHSTVDGEIFTLKIIRAKNFCNVKFSRFRSIREIFLTVANYNMDELLESLVYYLDQESQELLAVVVDWTFIPVSVDLRVQAYSLIVAA